MSYQCDRCDGRMQTFGMSYRRSLDHKPDQPDHPPRADDENGHLCKDCRDEFREFLEYS